MAIDESPIDGGLTGKNSINAGFSIAMLYHYFPKQVCPQGGVLTVGVKGQGVTWG